MARKPTRRDPPKRGRSTKRPRPQAVENSGDNSGEAEKVEQLHGGALLTGGVHGNKGGPGRPTDEIRQIARLSYEKRVPILEEIADGEPTEHIEVPLFYILKHAHCPACEGKLKVNDKDDLLLRFSVKASAKAKDRISAIEALRHVGIGNKVEVEVPKTPVAFGFYTSPEQAAAMQARENAA